MIRELAAQLYDGYWGDSDGWVPFDKAPDYVQEKWIELATTAVNYCNRYPE